MWITVSVVTFLRMYVCRVLIKEYLVLTTGTSLMVNMVPGTRYGVWSNGTWYQAPGILTIDRYVW
jgi:hypothetical protein